MERITVADLRAAIDGRCTLHTITVDAWNVRWLTDPDTGSGRRKRQAIQRALQARHVVLLSETHWHPVARALWQGACFPHTEVRSTTLDCDGGGGVAILCPEPLRSGAVTELIPGRAIAGDVTTPDGDVHTVIAFYFPPGKQ